MSTPVVTFKTIEKVSSPQHSGLAAQLVQYSNPTLSQVKTVIHILKTTRHNGFPVVDGEPGLVSSLIVYIRHFSRM